MSTKKKIFYLLVLILVGWGICVIVDWNRGRYKIPFWSYLRSPCCILMAPYNVGVVDLWSPNVSMGPFIEKELFFPGQLVFEVNWEIIRDEALALYEQNMITEFKDGRFFQYPTDEKWNRFFLAWYGKIDPVARKYCPFTVALIEAMPEVHMGMFSLLKPGGRILAHRGPFRGALRYHLGLVTPNSPDCYIAVDGKVKHWEDGEGFLFDDTYIHWVVNDTDQTRIILFLDVQRPLFGPGSYLNKFVCNNVIRHVATYNN